MRALLLILILAAPARADEPLCSGYPKREVPPPEGLSSAEIRATLAKARVRERAARCGRGYAEGTVKVRVTVEPSGRVSRAVLVPSTGNHALDRCLVGVARGTRFDAAAGETRFKVPLPYGGRPSERSRGIR